MEQYKVKALWALYSGGHDSLVSTHIASKHPLFRGVIHVNTKTSPLAQKVTEYARATAKANGWEFIEVSPFTTYAQLITKNGFPSPDVHNYIYQYLKGRPIKQAVQRAKAKLIHELTDGKSGEIKFDVSGESAGNLTFIKPTMPRKELNAIKRTAVIGLVSGMRHAESKRRSKLPASGKQDGNIWINPIIEWSKERCSEYINTNKLSRNRVSDVTGVSQECDCKCHAAPDELSIQRRIMPNMNDYANKLQELVRVSRELQLMEVQFGMRKPDDVIDEHDTVWGHGRKSSKVVVAESMPLFSICSVCEGQLDMQGNVGVDPDLMMLAVQMVKKTA